MPMIPEMELFGLVRSPARTYLLTIIFFSRLVLAPASVGPQRFDDPFSHASQPVQACKIRRSVFVCLVASFTWLPLNGRSNLGLAQSLIATLMH